MGSVSPLRHTPTTSASSDAAQARRARAEGTAAVEKTLHILEVAAERGGATARELSAALEIPLPTVYRLLKALVETGYLVHLARTGHYELGYKLHALGVSLHRQLAVPTPVRQAVDELHDSAEAAGYFANYRGDDVVLTYVSDCPTHPRIVPLQFGFHEAAHATAFGKILLAGMSAERRDVYLQLNPMRPLTNATVIDRGILDRELGQVAERGIAWEYDEFVPTQTCAAVPVRDAAGRILGAVAVSFSTGTRTPASISRMDRRLRECSARISRYYRSGATR